MSRLVVTGYASLDYPVGLTGQVRADSTTIIGARDPEAWPRAGGCPTYIAAATRRAGQAAVPVMWIGGGPEGQRFREALAAQGLGDEGLGTVESARSPTALMVYQADGSCICLYDPALDRREALSAAQRALIAGASHLCISVGPPQLMEEIVALCPPEARLYWAVKDDPDAFSPDLCRQLSARADVIFHSAPEAGLIGSTRAVLVQTRGKDGVRVTTGNETTEVPARPIAARDTTGAGDTFAGAFIGAEMAGADPVAAARRGVEAAALLLTERNQKE